MSAVSTKFHSVTRNNYKMSRKKKSSIDELVADLASTRDEDTETEGTSPEEAQSSDNEGEIESEEEYGSREEDIEDEEQAPESQDTETDRGDGGEVADVDEDESIEENQQRNVSASDDDEILAGIERIRGQSTFRDYPQLNDFFSKVYYKEDKRNIIRCKHCPWMSQTNEMERLFRHSRRCPGLDAQQKADLDSIWQCRSSRVSTGDSGDYNRLFAKIMVVNNLPFRLLDDRSFRGLINRVCPEWKLMRRKELSNTFIRGLSKEIVEKLNKETFAEYSLSIEFDYWKDIRRRSLLGILATGREGQRFLVELIDTTGETHSADATTDCLRRALTIDPILINSITSDSASNSALARMSIIQSGPFKHLINHRCMAHLLNRIGIKFVSCVARETLMMNASRMTAKIGSNEKLQMKLEVAGLRRVVCSTAVRWYSDVNMLESLKEVRMEATLFFRSVASDSRMLRLFEDDKFWIDLDQAILVMRPLADCIAVSEAKDSSLGSSFRSLLRLVAEFFKRDWSNPFIVEAIIAIVLYISPKKLGEEFGLILAAYSLDRRSKFDYVTTRGKELILKQLAKIGTKSGIDNHSIRVGLLEELPAFEEQRGRFSRRARPGESPLKWWSDVESSLVLKRIALRLGNLKSSSANIERTFSLMRLSQGHLRTNMDVRTLRDITRIKLTLIQ